ARARCLIRQAEQRVAELRALVSSAGSQQPRGPPEIDARANGLDDDRLGQTVAVSFEVKAGMPRRAPIDAARTGTAPAPDYAGKLGPRWLDGSRLDMVVVSVPNTVRLKGSGFIVIPPGETMPFGVDLDSDRLRLVFPLYLPEAQEK